MAQILELGLDTFGDVTAGAGGLALPHAQVVRNVTEEAEHPFGTLKALDGFNPLPDQDTQEG